MRGDSRQDLYAKSLALLGLGLLAGAGALVDYWPADVRVPHTPNASVGPVLARALAVPQLPAAPTAVANLAVRASGPMTMATVAPTGSFGATTVSLSLPALPTFSTFDVPATVATKVPAQPVALTPPALLETPDEDSVAPLRQFSSGPIPADPSEPDGTFLTGAFHVAGGSIATAGGSIVSAGVKTGQSVAGAFRAAAGAVKKIKFF